MQLRARMCSTCRRNCGSTKPRPACRTAASPSCRSSPKPALGVLSGATYARCQPPPCRPDLGRRRPVGRHRRAQRRATTVGSYTDLFRFARTMTLLAASAAEVAAIDTVFVNFRDAEALRNASAWRQNATDSPASWRSIPARWRSSTPPSPRPKKSVEQARGVVAAFAAAGNPGVVSIDGQMYDVPHLKRALRLLARADRAKS